MSSGTATGQKDDFNCQPCTIGTASSSPNATSSCPACDWKNNLVAVFSGMSSCVSCPQGKTASGPAACSESSSFLSNAALNSIVDGNNSFYLIVFGAFLCVALAVFIDRVKKNDGNGLVQMVFFYPYIFQFALFGGSLVSEFFLASGLVSGLSYANYGVAIFASRMLHLMPSCLVICSMAFTHQVESTIANTSFKVYLNTIHFFQNAFPYSLLLLLCLVEAPLLQYLPWRSSPFANVAGFPNLFLLRLALVIKSMQNIIVLICQFSVIAATSSSSLLTNVARTFLYINVALTLTIAILGFLEGYVKAGLLLGSHLSIEPNEARITAENVGRHGLELRESTVNPLGESGAGELLDVIPARKDENEEQSRNNKKIYGTKEEQHVSCHSMWKELDSKLNHLQSTLEAQGAKIDRQEQATCAELRRLEALAIERRVFAATEGGEGDGQIAVV